jgi:uncharacterized protein DUF6457
MDWIDEFAEALRREGGGVTVGEDERRTLLKLAREVAHRTERVFAPLSTYLVGRFVAERVRAGASPPEAVQEAFALAEEILPPPG